MIMILTSHTAYIQASMHECILGQMNTLSDHSCVVIYFLFCLHLIMYR